MGGRRLAFLQANPKTSALATRKSSHPRVNFVIPYLLGVYFPRSAHRNIRMNSEQQSTPILSPGAPTEGPLMLRGVRLWQNICEVRQSLSLDLTMLTPSRWRLAQPEPRWSPFRAERVSGRKALRKPQGPATPCWPGQGDWRRAGWPLKFGPTNQSPNWLLTT